MLKINEHYLKLQASYLFSDIAMGSITGLGGLGYILGLEALHELLGTKTR